MRKRDRVPSRLPLRSLAVSPNRSAGASGPAAGAASRGRSAADRERGVARLAINPNTVLKAYRELEHAGLVAARPGVGTFVTGSLADPAIAANGPLRRELR